MTNGELMKKRLLVAAFSFTLFLSLTFCVFAAETFNVPNLQNIIRTISLKEGDSVTGNFTVSGGSGNDVNFYVTDANGTEILRFDRTTGVSFSFSGTTTGSYTMNFDNKFSILASKTVTLDYSVKSAVLGIPQDTLLVLFGVAAIAVGVVVIIALLRRPKKT